MVGIKDVAAHAGVSVGTVSNTLNHPDSVSDSKRQLVEEAIAELGFVRNQSASQLRSGRSNTIALVVLDASNPFFVDVATGAETEAAADGHLVITCNARDDAARERRYLTMLEEQRVRGILITPVDESDHAGIELMARRGTPVVLVDRGADGFHLCSVAVDDVMGGQLAGDHLRELGHRRVAFIGGPVAISQVRDRLAGLRAAFTEVAHELTVVETPALSSAAGAAAAEAVAAMSPEVRPTAVFCANDLLALGALQTLSNVGLRVPDDVAIVGYDDIAYAASAVIPLTSVRQPREQLGRAGAQLLREEIEDGATHRHRQVLFEPELVVRASSTATGHEESQLRRNHLRKHSFS